MMSKMADMEMAVRSGVGRECKRDEHGGDGCTKRRSQRECK
jgi:hypothetical protein